MRSVAPSPRTAAIERALLAVARDDGRPALSPLERGRGRIEPQPASRLDRPMTRHAVAGQDRLDLAHVIDRCRFRRSLLGPGCTGEHARRLDESQRQVQRSQPHAQSLMHGFHAASRRDASGRKKARS